MSDALRTSHANAPPLSDADREARIEALLLSGLDHYFSGQYEQAINVWTRALFLDRNHARARAYIDRARGALAERAREAEECLQNGVAAAERGDAGEAHRLLQAAIERGVPSEDAQHLTDRLHRLGQIESPLAESATVGSRTRQSNRAAPGRTFRPTWALLAGLTGVVMIAGALLVASLRSDWNALLDRPAIPAIHPSDDGRLPLPTRGDMAMARARALVASGRLRDAMDALDRVRPTDVQKAEADRLRTEIQRQLIGLAALNAPAPLPDVAAASQP